MIKVDLYRHNSIWLADAPDLDLHTEGISMEEAMDNMEMALEDTIPNFNNEEVEINIGTKM